MSNIATEKNHLFEKAILRIIRQNKVVSRTSINKATGIRLSTITDITKSLLLREVIREANEAWGQDGQHIYKKDLMLNGEYCRLIGVDIQSRQITAILTDFCGNLLEQVTSPLEDNFSREQILETACCSIDALLQRAGASKVLGIGISTVGILNRKSDKVVVSFVQSKWSDINLKAEFSQRYPGLRIYVEDQVVCKLYAERSMWEEPLCANAVYVDISDVMGVSLFLNGKILKNDSSICGEIGHFHVSEENTLCTCGNFGCLCTVASSEVIVRRVRNALEMGTISILNEMTNKEYAKLDIVMVLQAAAQGDRVAANYLEAAALHVGKAISYVVNLLGPELVILGGSMITESEIFFDTIVREVKKSSLYLMIENMAFKKAHFHLYSGAIGAVCMVLDEFFEAPEQMMKA